MIRSHFISALAVAALAVTPAIAQNTTTKAQAKKPAATAAVDKPLCSTLGHPQAGKLADKDTGQAKEHSASPVHMDCIPDSQATSPAGSATLGTTATAPSSRSATTVSPSVTGSAASTTSSMTGSSSEVNSSVTGSTSTFNPTIDLRGRSSLTIDNTTSTGDQSLSSTTTTTTGDQSMSSSASATTGDQSASATGTATTTSNGASATSTKAPAKKKSTKTASSGSTTTR